MYAVVVEVVEEIARHVRTRFGIVLERLAGIEEALADVEGAIAVGIGKRFLADRHGQDRYAPIGRPKGLARDVHRAHAAFSR